jgi:hypothetical protein
MATDYGDFVRRSSAAFKDRGRSGTAGRHKSAKDMPPRRFGIPRAAFLNGIPDPVS